MSAHGITHHPESHADKHIGIFIAVLAVVMAVVGALAKNEANKMIVKEVQASNGFAWYQSKRQRSYMNELEIKRADFELAGAPTDAQRQVLDVSKARLKAKNAEYEKENDEIRLKAEAAKKEADLALHKHHWFEYSEIALHIAVVLSSLTLLTDRKLFFRLGVGTTIAGIGLAFYGMTITGHHADHAEGTGESRAPAAAQLPSAKH